MKDRSFHDYVVQDVLSDVDGLASRAMFGGWALYQHGVIFGIIVDGELYFKVDADNRAEYERMGSHPFTYVNKKGTSVTMPYWLVPDAQMEDREQLLALLAQSVAISRPRKRRRVN